VSDPAVVAPFANAVRQSDRSRERGHPPGIRWSNARHPVARQSVPSIYELMMPWRGTGPAATRYARDEVTARWCGDDGLPRPVVVRFMNAARHRRRRGACPARLEEGACRQHPTPLSKKPSAGRVGCIGDQIPAES